MSIISMYLIFSMLAVIWLDVTKFIIPNWLVGSLILLYPVAVWLSPVAVDWKMSIVAMLIVFAVGYGVFAMKWMGGGDIKLLTAVALWVGFSMELLLFIFTMSLIGGVFSVILWVGRKWVPHVMKSTAEKPLPRILQNGAPVPYGVAIAFAFFWWVMAGKIPVLAIS